MAGDEFSTGKKNLTGHFVHRAAMKYFLSVLAEF